MGSMAASSTSTRSRWRRSSGSKCSMTWRHRCTAPMRPAGGALGHGPGPLEAGGTVRMNGINPLDIPGQAGCNSIDGMAAYDEKLWATPAAKYGCAWDTGRAADLQQEVKNTNAVARGTFNL